MASVFTSNKTYEFLGDRREKHIDLFTKSGYILFHHLGDFLNASTRLYLENDWGYRKPNGTYDGMIGRLLRGEADIAGTAVFMNNERIYISAFVGRIIVSAMKFVFKQPKLSEITNLYVLPFEFDAWFAVLALMVLLAIAFYLSLMWHRKKSSVSARNQSISFRYIENEATSNGNHELLDAFDVVVSAVCQQATGVIPRNIISTIVMLVTYLSYAILFVCYSANIVSLLQSPSHKINSLEDMYYSSFKFSKVFYMQGYADSFVPSFPKLQQSIYYDRGMQQNSFFNLYDAVTAIRDDQMAFFTDKYQLYAIIDEVYTEPEKCGLDEMKFIPQSEDYYYMANKQSPYIEIMRIAFSLFQENGIHERVLLMYITKKPQCHSRDPFESAEFKACWPLIRGFLCGVCLSVLILIAEVIFYRVKKFLT